MATSACPVRRLLTTSLLLAGVLAGRALAQFDPRAPIAKWPADAALPLPDFDVRFDAQGRPAGDLHERGAALRRQSVQRARETERRALEAAVPFLRIDFDPLFGSPQWIASTRRFLTPPVPGGAAEPAAIVRDFVAAHPGLFEIAPEELDLARRTRDFVTRHNGAAHLTFQQQIGGVDLYGAELRANLSRLGELVNVSSTMLPRPPGGFRPSPRALSASRAIEAALAHVGVRTPREPATAERLCFPLARDEIRSAWKVVVAEPGVGNTYEVIVDATDGRILGRRNQLVFLAGGTQDLSLRVYAKDSPAPGSPGNPSPTGFQFPFDTRTLLLVTPASVPHSPNSWIDDNDNDTQGNNVDAHTDLDDDDSPDLPRPTGNPARVFDFPQDNTQPPSAWRDAAVTNLFYYCNRYHDVLHGLGFDEAAGNFQRTNFTGLGVANDRVQADAQDGGGTNNANFGTGSDGSTGRMQMYVFDGPAPARDGDLDGDIVYHEFTHGLSLRLHNLNLNSTQSGGMGEGWGDFFGVCLNAEPGDDPNGVYTTGGYATFGIVPGFVDNYYFGIRRFPYSTDTNKNPQTYADIDPSQQSYPPGVPRSPIIGNTANEVHNVGEVWCNTLVGMRAKLWASHGFAGNDLAMQLAVDGMKLDPGNPNFLQARDAILQADVLNQGGANQADLWTAFAQRGQGWSASSPGGGTSGIVEGFDLPIEFTYPDGVPTRLDPGFARTFRVDVGAASVFVPTPGTGQLWVGVNGGGFVASPMSEPTPNHYVATLPAAACLDTVRFYVTVDTNHGPVPSPGTAPAVPFRADVLTGSLTLRRDDFETDQGWTNFVTGASTGAWERGVPVDDPTWAYDPAADADGSGQCYLTMNQLGNTDVDGGSVTLVSPTLDLSGGADLHYAYYLNLTVDDGADQLLVEIDPNGGAGPWTPIEAHTSSGGTTWRNHTILAATIAAAGVPFTATTKVRFTANDGGTPSIVEAGLDAFTVGRTLCEPVLGTSFCSGDGSVAPCPCGNSGASGQGCQNSAGTHGARLVASGTSVPDAAFLTVTGELPISSSIVIQGDASIAPVPFGDGLRCVGGKLKRLYTRNASAGALTVPQPGDPRISARSAALGDPIPSGATRYYMTYYFDPASGFCPGPTFNGSNAVAIVW
jgi:hypothetical protein